MPGWGKWNKRKSGGGGDESLSTKGKKFNLTDKRLVTVSEFKGSMRVDIREFYNDKDSGDLRPGVKGISLSTTEWEKLKQLIPKIDAAVEGEGSDPESDHEKSASKSSEKRKSKKLSESEEEEKSADSDEERAARKKKKAAKKAKKEKKSKKKSSDDDGAESEPVHNSDSE